MASVAFSAAIGAALMLYVGFGMNMHGVTGQALYDGSVAMFTWTMKLGGILMAVAALLMYLGRTLALPMDAAVTAIVGIVLAATGLIWMLSADMTGILNLVFGALFLASAKRSWMLFAGTRGAAPAISTSGVRNVGGEDLPLPASDEATRQAAMERLLSAKRREGAAEAPPAAARKVIEVPQVETPAVQPADPPPVPAPAKSVAKPAVPVVPIKEKPGKQPSPPPVAEAAKADESPPEGFLAQLGRED